MKDDPYKFCRSIAIVSCFSFGVYTSVTICHSLLTAGDPSFAHLLVYVTWFMFPILLVAQFIGLSLEKPTKIFWIAVMNCILPWLNLGLGFMLD